MVGIIGAISSRTPDLGCELVGVPFGTTKRVSQTLRSVSNAHYVVGSYQQRRPKGSPLPLINAR